MSPNMAAFKVFFFYFTNDMIKLSTDIGKNLEGTP